MNISRALHRAPGRDHAADDRHRAGRHCSPSSCCRSRRCRRSISRPSRSARSCPAPARRPMATSVADAAGTPSRPDRRRHRDDLAAAARPDPHRRCSSTSTATSTARRATCRRRSTPRAPTCRQPAQPIRPIARSIPADAPILILALTSKTLTPGQIYDAATNVLQQKLSQIDGIGQVIIGGAALPAVRVELNPQALFKYGIGLEDVRAALGLGQRQQPERRDRRRRPRAIRSTPTTRPTTAADYAPLVVAYRNGAAVRLSRRGRRRRLGREPAQCRPGQRPAGGAGHPVIRQPGANIIETVDAREGGAAAAAGGDAGRHQSDRRHRPHAPRSAPRCTTPRRRC